MPALLIERAIDLARAEAGLALTHTRRIAVRGITALLGTVVACAFGQLTLVMLVVWPVLEARVPLLHMLAGVVASALLAAGGAAFAIVKWLGVDRERRPALAGRAAASGQGYDTPMQRRAGKLAERVSS